MGVELSTMLKYPATYNSSRSLKVWNFWRACLFRSIFVGAVCFFIPYFSVSFRGAYALDSIAAAGKIMYISLLGSVTFEICLIARSWSWIFFLFVFFSYTMVFALFLILPALEMAFNIPNPDLLAADNPLLLHHCGLQAGGKGSEADLLPRG